MKESVMDKEALRGLPSVDELLRADELQAYIRASSAALVAGNLRAALDEIRSQINSGNRGGAPKDEIIAMTIEKIALLLRPSVRRVINASGTILHTNIGRAVLCDEAAEAVQFAAKGNINLEIDLSTGERGERDSLVEGLIKRLTGAEAAVVVNNNAAAVLLSLNTLSEGREVIISRGELIEIGGSFRLPEIIKKSGCVLKEVGATNRTHPKDYEAAISPDTAIILKAHTSNYRIVGFTSEVGLKELSSIGRRHGIPVMEDLGSGSLVDLSVYGLPGEPTVRESLEDGADLVTFSGDKLLGGPQAGIIAGKKDLIDKISKNHLKRALRADKLTLAGLEATLRLYLNPERLSERLPALRHMVRTVSEIEKAAAEAKAVLGVALGPDYSITIEDSETQVGGGSLPGKLLPTKVLSITSPSRGARGLFEALLSGEPAILGRINRDRVLLDMRTVDSPEDLAIRLK